MAKKANVKPKLRREECYAKLVLEKVFPDRFYPLTISDKPDLQNTSLDIGVEVTTAVSKAEKEKNHRFSLLIQNKGTAKQKQRNIDRIEQLGGDYDDRGFMISDCEFCNLNRVYSALEDKLTKLNSGMYRPFSKQYVFITDINKIGSDEISKIHLKLSKQQEPFAIKFDSVFIYLFGGVIYEFNMQSGEDLRYRINDIERLYNKALQMANCNNN